MLALASLTNVCLGVALAAEAPRHPDRTAVIETAAGVALITGLTLLGYGLRAIY